MDLCRVPSQREQVSACVSVLERLLQALEPLYVIQNLREELQKGLCHAEDSVRILSIAQVGRIVEDPDAVTELLTSPELLRQIINCIGGEKIAVAKEAIKSLSRVAQTEAGLQVLFGSSLLSDLKNVMATSDVVRYRVYEVGTWGQGFVKFFGNLAVVDSPQQICERYPVFMEKVFEMAESQDPTMVGVAVDTLGVLGSNVEGKQVLQKTRSRFQSLLSRIGQQAKNAPTELRLRCLDAIAALLYLPPEQQTEDLLRMTESWFTSLSSQPLELFRSISTQPFPDLHCGALRVFTAIANQPWAQKLMLDSPGFVEYVVDRSVEPDKASKDAKYELVKALVNSKTIAEVFGNQYYLRLRAYLQEGPYYVKAVSTTAVEGAE
ncbi:26S proteasome non-ATPase regulatory subunit 5-like protein [Willisornis vidua]|uniref:26S proteasome non-ATPase regulatory subunit 5 n=1 Tax=Willisornis vidua TaxID=1566151 RepID=A0ABQ9DHC8_9PASS|nr:26S proteasome non-ATPase regulatory subunit 5-like protein [Willisornis vidua]